MRTALIRTVFVVTLALSGLASPTLAGQAPTGRDAVDALEFAPLEFVQPKPDRYEVSGVPVLLLEDRDLPLVTVSARFRGGYGLFGRGEYAAAMGLPGQLRYGGTTTLTPDSVDVLLDYYAIQTTFGTGGGSVSSTLNTLTEHLDVAMALWGDLLAKPGFDARQIDVWPPRISRSS